MPYLVRFSALCLVCCPSLGALSAAQGFPVLKTDPAVLSRYRDEPVVIEEVNTTVRMHADGTGDRLIRSRVRLQSEGAAQQFSVLRLTYASADETAAIEYVRVHKADGSVVETPVADAVEATAEVSREAPLYSDLKEKHLPVRSLAAGDTLEYAFHTVRTRPEAPGQFWGAEHFTAAGVVLLHETLTLQAPAAMYLEIWSPHHSATPTEKDGVRTWQWTNAQTLPSGMDKDGRRTAAGSDAKDPDQDAEGRNLPSVAWTTFHSWAEVGDWYRGLAAPRAEPNDALKAKADELTKAAKTPDEQVEALYQFVATQVRYVGIDLGIGRYQPHAAADVLQNGYGDCKDKDTLLEALLRAKGFATAPALIGVGIVPVPELPSPTVFNHVITTVELRDKRTWLDTTPEGEPFRVLVPLIRDQGALVVPAKTPASLERTPADPPFPYTERFSAEGELDKDGVLKSHMTLTVRSDNELGYRLLLRRAAPAQWDQVTQYMSGALGFGGKVSNSNLRQTDLASPVRITYDYTRPDFGDWANRRILPLFPSLEITTIEKDKAPEHDIDQGAPRTLEARTRIKLPKDFRADLPEGLHVKRSFATFDQTYHLEGGDLVIDRKVMILQHKVPKAQWQEYTAYTKAIGMDTGETYIQLLPPVMTAMATGSGAKGASTKTGQEHPAEQRAQAANADVTVTAEAPKGVDVTALQRLQEAREAIMGNDWDTAREKLKQAKESDPQTPGLMAMLGAVAAHDGNMAEAIADLKAELDNHPDGPDQLVLGLSQMYRHEKRSEDAITLLRKESKRKSALITRALANLQVERKDYTGAVATLEAGAAEHADYRGITYELADALQRAKRYQEAAAAAKAAMDESDDPNLLNGASYVLAETGLDLPFAEQKARHAVELLEKATADRKLQEVNSKAFAESSALAATWDTLGWILVKQHREAEGVPYLEAAWFNEPNVTVGEHLGEAYESIGKNSEALTLDELAMATDNATSEMDEFNLAKEHAERLRKAGAKSSTGDARMALQQMRSFHVKKETGVKGWGTFRVQLAAGGVVASDLVQGATTVKPMSAELNKLTIAKAVPPNSHARLVRDGVLSCSSERPECEFVLMPRSNLLMEGVQ